MFGVDDAVSGVANLGAAGLNYYGAKKANEANRDIMREQMGFQERMSNTAYQRSMADLQKAGLNPNLIYQHGGASSPAGASSTMMNELSPAVGSALQSMQVRAQVAQTRALTKLAEADLPEKQAAAKIWASRGGGWLKALELITDSLGGALGGVSKIVRNKY